MNGKSTTFIKPYNYHTKPNQLKAIQIHLFIFQSKGGTLFPISSTSPKTFSNHFKHRFNKKRQTNEQAILFLASCSESAQLPTKTKQLNQIPLQGSAKHCQWVKKLHASPSTPS